MKKNLKLIQVIEQIKIFINKDLDNLEKEVNEFLLDKKINRLIDTHLFIFDGDGSGKSEFFSFAPIFLILLVYEKERD